MKLALAFTYGFLVGILLTLDITAIVLILLSIHQQQIEHKF